MRSRTQERCLSPQEVRRRTRQHPSAWPDECGPESPGTRVMSGTEASVAAVRIVKQRCTFGLEPVMGCSWSRHRRHKYSWCHQIVSWTCSTLWAACRSLTTALRMVCLLYTSDAADEEDSVDLGGR